MTALVPRTLKSIIIIFDAMNELLLLTVWAAHMFTTSVQNLQQLNEEISNDYCKQ